MNNISRRGLSGGFSFIKASLVVILFAGAFLSFIPTQSNANTTTSDVIPVKAVLDFSSGGSKSAMISNGNLTLKLECDGDGVYLSFIANNGNAYANFSNTIIITPGELGFKDTPNQVDISSVFLSPSANTSSVTLISEADDPGEGQLGTFGPGVISRGSGGAMILSEAQVTYNLFGNNMCTYTGVITRINVF